MKTQLILLLAITLVSCNGSDTHLRLVTKTQNYFNAWNKHDFNHPDFANFKKDTSRTWHGRKEGEGSNSIFNPNSKWKQWDIAWNGQYFYDSLVVNIHEKSITGSFRETNDMLVRIGMPEGFRATVTYWFDKEDKVKETLYAWNKNNRSMHELLKPIVDWATTYDSALISEIYLSNGFEPSAENARKWKVILDAYDER